MNRRTAFAAAFALIASLFSGCKTVSSGASGDSAGGPPADDGMFSRLRQSDTDGEYSGLSSRSRDIERNLGVGRE